MVSGPGQTACSIFRRRKEEDFQDLITIPSGLSIKVNRTRSAQFYFKP